MRIKRLLSPQEGQATSQFAAVTVLALVVALAGIAVDRKVLADLAVSDAAAFKALVDQAAAHAKKAA